MQVRDLSRKICVTLQPIFVSKKLEQDLKPKEIKPSIVNRQCVVYKFVCDLCDADYVGYAHKCNGETKSHGKTNFNSRHNKINLQSNETSRQNKTNSRRLKTSCLASCLTRHLIFAATIPPTGAAWLWWFLPNSNTLPGLCTTVALQRFPY